MMDHSNNIVLVQVDYEKDDTEFIVKPQNENCKSDKMTIFVGVIYAYKGLLLVSINQITALQSPVSRNVERTDKLNQ